MAADDSLNPDAETCAYCGRAIGPRRTGYRHKRELDHIVPDKHGRGGCSHPENKVWVCSGVGGCNESKGDRTPIEFYNRLEKQGAFKAGEYSLKERDAFLANVAYWEALAVRHLFEEHSR